MLTKHSNGTYYKKIDDVLHVVLTKRKNGWTTAMVDNKGRNLASYLPVKRTKAEAVDLAETHLAVAYGLDVTL